ncbi:helix-turn-helix domain-containing protein [Niallia sp. FSL M8-0099]|uniref:helix-turn-helix domain-containing protein n=1 Tax=Niallia sp. FSL M8-0099 TaxID=2954519 RepID=UPI0030FCCCC8
MTNQDIYVKFHKHALTSGLMGALGAERWHTLSALALFMNDRGECFPSQDLLAEHLDIRRETVNRRIKSLCDFRWNGHPIITKEQTKHPTKQTYLQVRYLIGRESGFQFGNRAEEDSPCDADIVDRVMYM